MSDDFLTQLRAEVLDAHAAHRRRRRAGRALRGVLSAAPRALTAAAGAVVLVIAIVVVPALLSTASGSLRVLDVVRVGGIPSDSAVADGAVWVSDFAGRRVIRLDPESRRVDGRIAVGGQPVALAAGGGGVWARIAVGDRGAVERVGGDASAPVGNGDTLAAGMATVWAADVETGPERIHRIDAATGDADGAVALRAVYALAVGGRALWAVTGNGTVLRIDDRTGRVRARWPALALSSGTAAPALAADARGAWVLRAGQGEESGAIRVEGDRIVRRLPLDPAARPLLAVAPDGLWTVTDDAARHRSTAIRIDPGDGHVTARVSLGRRNPVSLAAVRDEVWVASSDGTVTVLGSR